MERGRCAYRTTLRFSRVPGFPTCTIHWYPTDLPFITFPTVFNSQNWDESPWTRKGLGEVYGEDRLYHQEPIPPGLPGDHICGTEEMFMNGRPADYAGPEPIYDPDGIPQCCRRRPVGFVQSGVHPNAIDTFVTADLGNARSGAVVNALDVYVRSDEGNVQSGAVANAAEQLVGHDLGNAESGAEVNAAEQLVGHDLGNVESGAEVNALDSQETSDEGNVESGAEVNALDSQETSDEGNVQSGAVANALDVYVRYDRGNARSGAVVNALDVYVRSDEGNVQSGAVANAIDVYVPGTPTPGTSCATAGVDSLGVTYSGPQPGIGVNDWFVINGLTNGTTYYIATTNVGGMGGALMVAWEGSGCSSLSSVFITSPHANCFQFTKTGNGSVWFQFGGSFGGGTYGFTVSTTPC